MAIVGVSIVKRVSFRDSTQEFSNTYHYDNGGLTPSALEAGKIIDQLVVIEKAIHSGQVSFVRAKVWSAGGTIAQNVMLTEKVLSGVGSATTVSGMDRERAFLIQWDAGVDSRNHKVRLKKWFHVCGAFGTFVPATNHLDNTLGFTQGQRDLITAQITGLNPLIVDGISYDLKSNTGRTGSTTPSAHKFLEHHQMGDQWRG